MKRLITILSAVVVLSASAIWAHTAPLTLTLQSYETFSKGLRTIADAMSPGAGDEVIQEMLQDFGIQELKGIDTSRPWQVGVWLDSLSVPPCLSLRIPVLDFAAFRDGLQPGLLQGGPDAERPIEHVGDYAKVWIEFGQPSEATQAAEKTWNPDILKETSGGLHLAVRPPATVRNELVGMLGGGRMAIAAAMSSQAQQFPGGMDTQAMGELMGVYFDLLEMGVKGLEALDLRLDLENDTLVLREEIVPVAGSELAGWFQTQAGDLGSLHPYLDPKAPMALAIRMDETAALMPKLKRLVALSMRMQGLPAESNAIRETEQLLEAFLPLQFAGAVDIKETLKFGGVSQFPGQDAAAVYAHMKEFLQKTMQDQVGDDKPYQSVTLEEGLRKVAGLSVDRATMVINLDAPIYQMPGQKEMIEGLWPGGRMVFDYALKGDNLLMGSPDRLDALLSQPPSSPGFRPEGLNAHTMAFGYFNILELLPRFLALNPMIPEAEKERFSNLDAAGTAIDFRLDLDGRLTYRAGIPLKLFRTLRQLTP